jgi:hypothetical protein
VRRNESQAVRPGATREYSRRNGDGSLLRMQKNEDHTQDNGKISFGRDPAQTKSGGKQTALRPKSLKKNGTVVCWESCCAETKSNESKGICCKVK